MKDTNIVILGASGYTGAELLRFLLQHPHVTIKALTADTQAGKSIGEIYPHLVDTQLLHTVTNDAVDYTDVDAVFCCLPHGTTQEIIAKLPKHVRIIDLSADFRLHDLNIYAEWYGHAHRAPDLQKEAVYGLTELNRDAIKSARLVANPGCYPTSAQLPLVPLLKAGLIQPETIIIDAKSGVTGAGRSAKQANLFTEINEGVNAYSVGAHRHAPEIEQGLTEAHGKPVIVSFTPHLIPMNRGILSTIYITMKDKVTVTQLREELDHAYATEPFVHVLREGQTPSTHQVRGTNRCHIGVFKDRLPNRAIIVSAIDNLTKGASGQAVQNFNLMFGYEETLTLESVAVFP